jgi:hypothetical protein
MIILTLILISFGSTYAYFSSKTIAIADMSMHNINVAWADMSSSGNAVDGLLSAEFSDINHISMVSKLKRGEDVSIKCLDKTSAEVDVFLAVSIDAEATTPVYCRIKLTATYEDGGTTYDFSQYVEPKYKYPDASGTMDAVSGHNWIYDNGYYYYKSGGVMSKMSPGRNYRFANYLYLSDTCSADLLGRSVKLSLTVEVVQASTEAYKEVWGIN